MDQKGDIVASLSPNTKGKAPQAPRYTSYAKLIEATTLDDLWK